MGADQPQPTRSPLKLPLSSLPSQPRSKPQGLMTPPLQPMGSVPFLWEEAPGKPRPFFPVATSPPPPKTKVARCLDLPPRLLMTEGKMTNTPSLTTVLDGAYSGGRTLSRMMSFTFGKASFRIPEGKKQIGKERGNFSSLRWEESFKENYDCESGGILDFSPSAGDFPESFAPEPEITTTRKRSSFFGPSKSNFWASFRIPEGKKQIGKERGNFSSLRWEESFKENYDCESGGILDFSPSAGDFPESFAPEPEITRTRKRSSFFGSSKSNFWTSIYENVKQAVRWRRKQEKTRRMNYSYI